MVDAVGPPLDRRDEFLIAMYNQLWQNINRHIMILWEGVGILVAVLAVYGLVEKNVLPPPIAASVAIGAAAWVVAHTYDSSHWYNRNLLMITNIERQFLRRGDLKEIHYFFEKHRSTGEMIMFLRIQWTLAAGTAALVLAFYTVSDFLPRMTALAADHYRLLGVSFASAPYGVAILALLWTELLRRRRNRDYAALLQNSPGKAVE
jgi:hypothetical protein